MPKNLLVLSLEGVSQTMFWQYREVMPALWRLSLRSTRFRRFYSTSTSEFQSFADFLHGDAMELDHHATVPTERAGCLAGRAENLFALLWNRQYRVLGIRHRNPAPGRTPPDCSLLWPEACGSFKQHGDYQSFYGETETFLQQAKADGKPFALYYADQAARLDDVSPEKETAPLYHERFEKGFALLDQSAARALDLLSRYGLLENTIVAVFGPYGMDPWRHGMYRGAATGINPYADLCWTPFFLYNNGNDIDIVDPLAGVIDVKPTLLHMLFPEETIRAGGGPLAGIDLLQYQRGFVLTQNMFALEREGEGRQTGLAKSYAATDGEMRLMASSDGGIPGEGGLELYFDPRDPGNTRNLLDFFDLDANGVMTAFGRADIVHVHFSQSFQQRFVLEMAKQYNALLELLRNCVHLKEAEAAKLAKPSAAGKTFADAAFTRKRRWE